MLSVAIYIKDTYTQEYNRLDLFNDEKISVTSSIQNINDLSKTFTDFSQTFTAPATKQNNKIFRHWYDNSNDEPFSTLVKSDAYIEIDTIFFRSGKIQLESANLENGQPKDYSITFIGTLGNLKDTFNGLFLKDLTDDSFDFVYDANVVKNKVTSLTPTSPPTPDIAFPLISSSRNWVYGGAGVDDINDADTPIRYNELFPALKVKSVLEMIENEFGVNFNGSFLSDNRFVNSYLLLKNSELFTPILQYQVYDVNTIDNSGVPPYNPSETTIVGGYPINDYYWTTDLVNNTFTTSYIDDVASAEVSLSFIISSSGTGTYEVQLYNITDDFIESKKTLNATQSGSINPLLVNKPLTSYHSKTYQIRIIPYGDITISASSFVRLLWRYTAGPIYTREIYPERTSSQFIPTGKLIINKQFPEIKIEDFFSGLLKMFNLTCYSNDGINYNVEQLESYYNAGLDVDLTKYIIQDKKALNRVKTYKKINFDYEKSESFVNVAFASNNGIEYGSLYYSTTPPADGEEYSVKLPFEDLGFLNLTDRLQVAYALKNDGVTKYIPKPVIFYDYTPSTLTTLVTGINFKFSTALTGTGSNTIVTSYKAFGQETLISGETYGLNFPPQISTLTNQLVEKGLYNQYYQNYFNNIFNFKARLVKVSAILPTSILTSLKLNDSVIIRDTKYIINTMTTDLTTGEVQFELLTDQRQ